MAISVGNNQNYRLRELRNEQLGRTKGEAGETRRPSRTTRRFDESMKNPKAGEVVGEFPAKYDRAPKRQQLRRDPLQVAKERSRPRSPVAALMARDGISTHTKMGAKFAARAKESQTKREEEKAAEQPAWMTLLDEAVAGDAEAKARLEKKKQEIKAVDGFLDVVGGYSELEQSIRRNDERTLKEAGRVDRALQMGSASFSSSGGPKTKQEQQMSLMKAEMQMDQQLNMRYLALQDKMQKGYEGLMSNIMKLRNDLAKEAISGGG